MPIVTALETFGVTPTGLTGVDSITTGNGSFFVEYGNGASSTGGPGASTIIQYDAAGKVQYAYDITGSVDGLKYNPTTGKVWALQNQDGHSTLSLIDPKTHTVTGPIAYANASATRGFDDVVFKGNRVFLSYTNPSSDANPAHAATIVELIGGEAALGKGALLTQPILTTASMGVDTVTGKTSVVPQIDPDSLKLADNGDLLFTSGDGGVIIEVKNPGDAKQSVTYTPIKGVTAGGAGLDDVIRTNATAGTFYVADAKGDRVVSFHVSGLNPNDYYASVGGAQNAFGQIDPKTGKFTALVSNANEKGFGSPHGVTFVADAPVPTTPKVTDIETFGVTPTGLTGVDSITTGNGSFFVEYGNGASSTGGPGASTIIQYDAAGKVQYAYDITGSVDGLKYNPTTGKVWALQNQDGHSTLSLIDPKTHTVTGPIAYANASATRGFDDVVFKGNRVFLSYTNPSSDANPAHAATIVELIGGEAALGKGALLTQPILTTASMGVDTVTGKTSVVPQIDPDSLKLADNGDLLFTSGDGGVIIEVKNPGDAKQSVTYTPIKGVTAGGAGLDDVIRTNATAGTFYVADAKGDRVVSFHVSGLNPNDYYASVGGAQNAFGQIDPKTGKFTALVSNANEKGFGSPHGVTFVADAPVPTTPKVTDIETFGVTPTGLTGVDSITTGNGSFFVEYGNGASSTGGPGASTIIQYDAAGKVQYAYDITGSVDGLKYNPTTGKVWALQNQDGHSTLSLIDPKTHTVTGPIAYANASATRGFDDVVFKGNRVFLSYTNPSSDANPAHAATIVELIGGEAALGKGALLTQPILTTASMGVDTVTGKTSVVPQIDPDSLKLADNGDLLFTSGDGGVIIEVKNPGDAKQSVTYTPIKGVTAGGAGLDDVIRTNATAGTFYVADAKGDRVVSFHVSGLNPNDYYASVGGAQNAFGQIDPKTGKFTALVSNANEKGFGSPHGVTFVADAIKASAPVAAAHLGTTANQAALLSHYMASAFVANGVDTGGKVIGEVQAVVNPLLTHPRHA